MGEAADFGAVHFYLKKFVGVCNPTGGWNDVVRIVGFDKKPFAAVGGRNV